MNPDDNNYKWWLEEKEKEAKKREQERIFREELERIRRDQERKHNEQKARQSLQMKNMLTGLNESKTYKFNEEDFDMGDEMYRNDQRGSMQIDPDFQEMERLSMRSVAPIFSPFTLFGQYAYEAIGKSYSGPDGQARFDEHDENDMITYVSKTVKDINEFYGALFNIVNAQKYKLNIDIRYHLQNANRIRSKLFGSLLILQHFFPTNRYIQECLDRINIGLFTIADVINMHDFARDMFNNFNNRLFPS